MEANHYRYCSFSREIRIRTWLAALPKDVQKYEPANDPLAEDESIAEVGRPKGMQTWPDLPWWGEPNSPARLNAAFKVFQDTLPSSLAATRQSTNSGRSGKQAKPEVPARSPKRPVWRP